MSASHFETKQKRQTRYMKTKKKNGGRTWAEMSNPDLDLAQQLGAGEAKPQDWPGEDDGVGSLWSDIGFDFPYGGASDELLMAAEKAVASAMVHNLMGLPATALWIEENYVRCGTSETDMTARANGLREVAGYSWGNQERNPFAGFSVHLGSPELENAREVVHTFLDERRPLKYPCNTKDRSVVNREMVIDVVVSEWVLRVENVLHEHHSFIQRVARLLVKKGRLSAKQFAFWMRHARIWKEKREKRVGTGGFDPSNN